MQDRKLNMFAKQEEYMALRQYIKLVSEASGGTGGRPVGQEGQLGGDLGQHGRTCGERCQFHGTETPHPGGVPQQVQRGGGKNRQCGQGETENGPHICPHRRS